MTPAETTRPIGLTAPMRRARMIARIAVCRAASVRAWARPFARTLANLAGELGGGDEFAWNRCASVTIVAGPLDHRTGRGASPGLAAHPGEGATKVSRSVPSARALRTF